MRSTAVVLSLSVLLVPCRLNAAFEPFVAGARPAALGGAMGAAQGDLWAGVQNPAALSGLRGLTLGAWSVPSVFGIRGLGRAGVAAGMPVPHGGAGLLITSFGLPGYRETVFSASAATPVSNGATLGLRVNAFVLAIPGYGTTITPTCDAGLRIGLSENLALSCLLVNLTGARIGAARESLPLSLSLACAFTPPSTGLACFASCSRELLSPMEWSAGVEYAVFPELQLRTGLSTDPSFLCAGLGVSLSPVTFDYALTYHGLLGATHHVSVSVVLD